MERLERPFPTSLCHGCAYLRDVKTERTWFLMCNHPALPKYAPQPVTMCAQRQHASPVLK
ncbi:MAG: hypothetical protein JNG84_01670 [Archangium sp.]|nr:hypothetical protein [Archangium sp.]